MNGTEHGSLLKADFTYTREMAVEDGMFIDITGTFYDIIMKHYKRNISITISAGLWQTIDGHVQTNSQCTYRDTIDELLMASRHCITRFISDDIISFLFSFDSITDMELWASAKKDHLGRFTVDIFLPSEY